MKKAIVLKSMMWNDNGDDGVSGAERRIERYVHAERRLGGAGCGEDVCG